MKHRSIQRTITPQDYATHNDPKKQALSFNRWATYIHKEVKKLNVKQ